MARQEPESIKTVREFSTLVWALERFFLAVEFLSPTILFIDTRNLLYHKIKQKDADEREAYTTKLAKKRSQLIDAYIIGCIAFELSLILLLVFFRSGWTEWLVQIWVFFRIIDIIQANFNLNIFDRLRFDEGEHLTASYTRNLILGIITFNELILCFALYYLVHLANLQGAQHWHDALYFSTVTQITIGYGDIKPLGIVRLIAGIHAVVGLMFTLIIMGRMVSVMPNVKTVLGDHGTDRSAR